ncbi:26S proteasome non-ATPase regulatory subunit [Physocladia obscura]|uniref:26S proteasome non-ATPase regulatory subunit n=1 Tax=Physocladia obscura TaxID=109957 RepID=A0AAD5SUQ5_9FUNG|nr:26S proteasome non-ATPase regulatory subunit [Physocladia obscura]
MSTTTGTTIAAPPAVTDQFIIAGTLIATAPPPIQNILISQAHTQKNNLEIKQNVALLERSVISAEPRFAVRALRASAILRSKLSLAVLAKAAATILPKDAAFTGKLSKYFSTGEMDVDVPAVSTEVKQSSAAPEVEIYLGFLILVFLHDSGANAEGLALSSELVDYIQQLNRRTLDQLAAKIYFYYERFFELANRLTDIRPKLLAAQRTASLRHDDETQAVLLNLLLRNYIHFNLYDQADKLVSKTAFPENAGNSQSARYFYYLGERQKEESRIKAIQLDYTASHRDLIQAIRKAPKNPKSAGFQQAVHKLAIIVQLLTGEIPERSVFREPFLREALVPYLSITQAVRIGDLGKFQNTLTKYITTFRVDKTYTLILRLRHNVIKTGIRMISLAYSKISLKDICLKLQLDSEEDAEYIVGKAIRDGVIDAIIEHEHGFMKSKEIVDIYSTNEPQNAFHNRITFCLNLHNESVKALRFPYSQRKETSLIDTMREEERLIAGELAEADLDNDDMGEF